MCRTLCTIPTAGAESPAAQTYEWICRARAPCELNSRQTWIDRPDTPLPARGAQAGEDGARALLDAWSAAPDADRREYLDISEAGDLGSLLPDDLIKFGDAQA